MSALFLLGRRALLLGGLALALPACVDPYLPDAIKTPPSYLVVDGYLSPVGITTIKLSRTFAVASASVPPVETKANVYIEDEGGARNFLRESPNGTYTSSALALAAGRKYRLHINTLGNKEYVSDYVPVKITPPIDNLNWRPDADGLNIYLNTHDATGTTQYYRWEYDETWEILPPYAPTVEYVNRVMRPIVVAYPTICWGNTRSTTVQLDKTTTLTQDVVSDFRLRRLPNPSELLYSRYSILVQQHALTKDEYAYWELLRKNTESIGTLFDPQPAPLTGNVRCLSNPADLALGFVSAHTLVERRLFIRRGELPASWRSKSGYEACLPADTVALTSGGLNPMSPAEILAANFSTPNYLPINPYFSPFGSLLGYLAKGRDCVDCRTRGTAVKPSFWP